MTAMERIQSLVTPPQVSVKEAWKKLSDNGYRVLFVVDAQGHLVGSVTDGDVRRWILQDGTLGADIAEVMKENPIVAYEDESEEAIRKKLLEHRIECVPIINRQRAVQRVVFWDDFFKDIVARPVVKMQLPVVIMAGGLGCRLEPITKILPKPLIPIGDKPVIEIIMEKFARYGVRDFFVSVNYKANMIKAYFQDSPLDYNIQYCEELTPSGTAGSLSLLKGKVQTSFIVSNADIIIDADYTDIVDFHVKNQNQITLVCSMKHFAIPYGVVEIENGGELKGIQEKPELDHLVLTGFYVMEPELLRHIPDNQVFHMTHLIDLLRVENQKIGVYPVSEKAWMDVGEMDEYREVLRRFENLV